MMPFTNERNFDIYIRQDIYISDAITSCKGSVCDSEFLSLQDTKYRLELEKDNSY